MGLIASDRCAPRSLRRPSISPCRLDGEKFPYIVQFHGLNRNGDRVRATDNRSNQRQSLSEAVAKLHPCLPAQRRSRLGCKETAGYLAQFPDRLDQESVLLPAEPCPEDCRQPRIG